MVRRGSVNWQDGMLIQASHFIADTAHLREVIGRNSGLSLGWFGVFAEPGEAVPLDLNVAINGLECTAELRRFRGYFPDGTWLEFEADASDVVVARRRVENVADQELPVCLFVSTDQFYEFGEPDPALDPPRRPFRQPRLQLSLEDPEDRPARQSMVLGRIQLRDGVAALDPAVLPACATMASWPALRDLAARFAEALERWRRFAVDHFVVLLPVATAPAGGTGRELEFAQRETAFQWAMEVARLQAVYPLLARRGTPPLWFAHLQSAARSILTLLELNREMARDVAEHEQAALTTLRRVIDYVPDPNSLGGMLVMGQECLQAMDRVLPAVFTHEALPSSSLVYQNKTYYELTYARRSCRTQGELAFLEISGLSASEVEDCVLLVEGETGVQLAQSRPNARLGPNDRGTWPSSDPAFLDVSFKDRAVLVHPIGFRPVKELNRLTLVCLGAGNLSAFERGSDQEIRVFAVHAHTT